MMPSETNKPETPSQEDSTVATRKETKLDRLANEAASRGKKRQQRFDLENNTFPR
jgi:hypothetical protein